MTNKEWLMGLSDDEFYKQMANLTFKCDTCVYWRGHKCISAPSDSCMKGHVLWLKEEHHE